MAELDELGKWLKHIEDVLSDSQKKRLTKKLTTILKRASLKRIRAQLDPDGHKFTPRKRDQKGSIRRQVPKSKRGAMFKKIVRNLQTINTSSKAEVGFSGRNASIMKTHQFGGTARPSPSQSPVRYAVRETVGFSSDDEKLIIKTIKDFILSEV